MDLKVICLQTEAFYALIDEVVSRIKEKQNVTQDKWNSTEEAMEKLRIKSKTTFRLCRCSSPANIAPQSTVGQNTNSGGKLLLKCISLEQF